MSWFGSDHPGIAAWFGGGPNAVFGLGHSVVAGGAAGDFTVTGITADDTILEVIHYQGDGTQLTGVEDLTAEFSITAADTINNTGGTATTNGFLVVRYARASEAPLS